MMNLLKYDWKRNSTLLLSTLAVLIIVQAALSIVGEVRDWNEGVTLVLSILGYVAVVILIYINCCRTFDHNIKSFSRRLLPLHPLKGVGAVVLLSWLGVIAVTLIAVIHILLYLTIKGMSISELLDGLTTFSALDIIKVVAAVVWLYTSLLITIMAAITITRCFRSKHAIWIGIIFFFAGTSLVGWLENLLFEKGSFDNVTGESSELNNEVISFTSSLQFDIPLGPILLEMACVAALLYLITYLLNKKVEI